MSARSRSWGKVGNPQQIPQLTAKFSWISCPSKGTSSWDLYVGSGQIVSQQGLGRQGFTYTYRQTWFLGRIPIQCWDMRGTLQEHRLGCFIGRWAHSDLLGGKVWNRTFMVLEISVRWKFCFWCDLFQFNCWKHSCPCWCFHCTKLCFSAGQ